MTAADLRAMLDDAGLHIPGAILRRADLTHTDRIIVALLLQIERMKSPAARWPSYSEMAAALDCATRTFQTCISRLARAGVLVPGRRNSQQSKGFTFPQNQRVTDGAQNPKEEAA